MGIQETKIAVGYVIDGIKIGITLFNAILKLTK